MPGSLRKRLNCRVKVMVRFGAESDVKVGEQMEEILILLLVM